MSNEPDPREPTVGIAVITHNSRAHLRHCLPKLLQSSLKPSVLVVNSSSTDGTVEEAERLGANTLIVPRDEFNHGTTREHARRALGTNIVIFLTPDAYPQSTDFVEKITAPLRQGNASISYGRQLARPDADFIEAFTRTFNYPPHSHERSFNDWPKYGSYTHFCSNSCAAWSQAALDSIGGFESTLVSEETIATAKLLRRGHRIAYAADATVLHSHPTSLIADFKRQFDIGYARAAFRSLLLRDEPDERRGRAFARSLIRACLANRSLLLPYACADLAAKYLGYRLGMLGSNLPSVVRRAVSGQDYYWSSTAHSSG